LPYRRAGRARIPLDPTALMDALQGKHFFVWLVATPLACILAWWLMRRYKRALLALMRAPPATRQGDTVASTDGVAQSTAALPAWLSPTIPSLRDWRRAEWRLIAILAGLSLAKPTSHSPRPRPARRRRAAFTGSRSRRAPGGARPHGA
jgi:hypothetical protein